MDYELTEKYYSLFDINEVLDSINIAPETFMVTLSNNDLFSVNGENHTWLCAKCL